MWLPIALVFVCWLVAFVILSFAFSWRFVKCPNCGEAFVGQFVFTVPEACGKCGFNVRTLSSRDNF